MSEDGQRQRQLDNYADPSADESIVSEAGAAERIITDSDAAREIPADVADDDPELEYKLSVYRYEEQPAAAFAAVDFSRIGEQAEPPRRGRGIADYAALLLLILIPVVIGLLLLVVSQTQKQQANQPAVAPATAVPAFYSDKIAIVGNTTTASADGSGAEVNITVRNSGDQPVQVVSVQVRVFDEAGKQVGSAGIVTVSNIAPGELGRGSTTIRTDRPIDQRRTEFRVSSVLVPNVPTMSIVPSPTVIGGGNR